MNTKTLVWNLLYNKISLDKDVKLKSIHMCLMCILRNQAFSDFVFLSLEKDFF